MASNSEKRKQSRIQGAWSDKTFNRETSKCSKPSSIKPRNAQNQGDTMDVKYVSTKIEKNEPTVTTISESGVYDISTGPSGVSRLILKNNFIAESECEWMFEQLNAELPWQQRLAATGDGEASYRQPRLTAWYGDLPFTYSGVTQHPNPQWSPVLVMLKDLVESDTGLQFNSMLANLYRNGHDHVPWHSDDEKALGAQPTIASLTFGDTRMFQLKKRLENRETDGECYKEFVNIPLRAGSLLLMQGAVQQDWHHRIGKEYHDRGPRINLTFRVVLPTAAV